MLLPKRIKKIISLSDTQLYILIILAACLLLLPTVFSGLMGDDLLHYMMINQNTGLPKRDDFSLFNLFSFISKDPEYRLPYVRISLLPWWIGADFSWNFWRPLSEVTHYLDYRFLDHKFWLMHLHSLLYFVVLLCLLKRWFSLLFKHEKMALLAFALFALGSSHAITVAWLSNRHALLASIGIIVTLILHHFYCEKQKPSYLYFACISLVAALFSGELGICAGAWLFSYAVFIDKRGIKPRVISLLPYLVIACCWLYLYRLGDFGISGFSTFYIDPFERPFAFLQNYLSNLPTVILSQIFVVPSDLLVAIQYKSIIDGLGYLVLMLLFFAGNKVREKSLYRFFLCAFVLTLFPIASSPAQDRNLLQVSIAGAGLLAILLVHLYRYFNGKQRFHQLAKYLLVFLLMLHFIISPLLIIPLGYSPAFFSASGGFRAKTLDTTVNEQVVIIKGDMMESTYLYPNLVLQNKPLPNRLWNLGGHDSALTMHVINAHQIKVDSSTPYFSTGDQMARHLQQEPFVEGQMINLDGLLITIDNVADNGQPESFTLNFSTPISAISFFLWQKSGYKKLALSEGVKLSL